jgi:hypothetical protein
MSFKEFAATEKAAKKDKATDAPVIGPPNKATGPEIKTAAAEPATVKT